jgi:phage regulator Rha-like protein
MKRRSDLIPSEAIGNKIHLIRGRKVILDFHVATLYGAGAKVLLQSVKRNVSRFPDDFMFELNESEFASLRSQIVTSNRGGRRYHPYAFTEQGVAMLSSVLHSERAIQVNIAIMRAFVKLREILSAHKELSLKLKQLEMKLEKHDEEIQAIFQAIAELMAPPPEKVKRPIGFTRE